MPKESEAFDDYDNRRNSINTQTFMAPQTDWFQWSS